MLQKNIASLMFLYSFLFSFFFFPFFGYRLYDNFNDNLHHKGKEAANA